MRHHKTTPFLFALFCLATAACGSGDPKNKGGSSGGGGDLEGERYLPLAVDNRWEYRVTDPATGETAVKVQTIETLEPVPGNPALVAYRFRTEKLDGTTESWQALDGGRLVRYFERSYKDGEPSAKSTDRYTPAQLRLDEGRLAVGASWTENYSVEHTKLSTGEVETKQKQRQWTVVSVGAPCAVEAGSFDDCLVVRRRVVAGGEADKTFTFARGVGKVKEEGGQIEELLAFQVEVAQ
jgi:hypothetical protein